MNTPTALPSPSPATRLLTVAAALGLLCGAAHAASVYRCGPQGNVYSDQPCVDGRLIAAADERSDEQRAQAIRVAALERRFAAEMHRERLAMEAMKPVAAANVGPRPGPVVMPPKAHPHVRQKHSKRLPAPGSDFVALVPRKRN